MKIGIIAFSNTGHTAKLAEEIGKRIEGKGHSVEKHFLEIAGTASPVAASVELKSTPSIKEYDAVLFGFPVWGGRPPIVMNTYLDRIGSLNGKKIACFATHFFFPAWGGTQSLKTFKEICELKGADVICTGSVQWSSFRRHKLLREVASKISTYF